MSENIFKILKVADKEDVISNLLVQALNKVATFRSSFLELIIDDWENQYHSFQAYTRTLISETGVPDILINIEQEKGVHSLIIIENKLKAKEGEDQTKKYSSQKMVNKLKGKFSIENVNKYFIFLTLFPEQTPSSDKFKKITYEDLLKVRYNNDSIITRLLRDFSKILEEFYNCREINPNDNIFKKLYSVPEIDGGYLYFKTFINNLALDKSLNIEEFFRGSKTGRKYYGARISKSAWHPSKMNIDKPEDFVPKENFNIHFEPQYDVLNKKLILYLHYEVNPYQTKNWVEEHIPKTKYDKYLKKRNKVKDKLKNKDLEDLKISGYTNQIAKATIDFQDKNAEELIKSISEFINKVASEINDILYELTE